MDLEDAIESSGLFYGVNSAMHISVDPVDCNTCNLRRNDETSPCADSQYIGCSMSKDAMTGCAALNVTFGAIVGDYSVECGKSLICCGPEDISSSDAGPAPGTRDYR